MNQDLKKNYNLSFAIILANIAIYIITYTLYYLQIVRLNLYLGLNPVLFLKYKHFWTPITYMFAHSGFTHLFFNMFVLFMFGHSVEERMGSRNFAVYYLLTGTLAGLFSLVIYYYFNINVLLIGASGAIYSLLFAYAVFYPNRKIYIFGIIPIKPPMLILLYTGYDLFSQIFRSTNVAHITHLSGFLFAYLYFRFVYKINPIYIFKNYRKF